MSHHWLEALRNGNFMPYINRNLDYLFMKFLHSSVTKTKHFEIEWTIVVLGKLFRRRFG